MEEINIQKFIEFIWDPDVCGLVRTRLLGLGECNEFECGKCVLNSEGSIHDFLEERFGLVDRKT